MQTTFRVTRFFSDILTSLLAHAVPNVSIRAGSISDFRKSKRYR